MEPKPRHLQADYAAQFQDTSIVAAYHHRPPYPDEVFDILVGLLPATGRAVLDAGCGTGDIARPLAPRVERLDAVDWSRPMIERGRMDPTRAAAFDAAVAELLRLYAAGGRVTIHITGLVTWGYPLAGR